MNRNSDNLRDSSLKEFINSLSEEERLLIVLKKELYECRWDEMVNDLCARLNGRPYIYKLINRIEDDLERIDKLKAYEAETGLDLSDYVSLN